MDSDTIQPLILPSSGMIEIYTDGASRSNPGPAACAWIAVVQGNQSGSYAGYLGKKTNNEAEYAAITNALVAMKPYADREIRIISDSELVIRQITGVYQTRAENLQGLLQKVRTLIPLFCALSFENRKRGDPWITRCDALCNQVLDQNRT